MKIEPIAIFHSPLKEKFGIPRQAGVVNSLGGTIELQRPYNQPDALRGLEEFDYVWLIWGFSLNRPRHSGNSGTKDINETGKHFEATVRPPRLGGNARVGVFASRSPFRPNGLGLSAVRITKIDFDKCTIEVRGADLADGTPVYDIKPYLPYVDSIPQARGGFASRVKEYALEVEIPGACLEKIPVSERETLRQILSQDPRPSYQDDPERMYGMGYAGMEVKFQVKDGRLLVRDIETASKDPAQEEKGRK